MPFFEINPEKVPFFIYTALPTTAMTLGSSFCKCLINVLKISLPSYLLPGLECTASTWLLAFVILQNFIPP